MSGKIEGFGRHHNRKKQERNFKVFIHEGELRQIKEWVLKKEHIAIETGGDLFGLWIDQHTAVVQFVLGPGKGCTRTYTSFYQDVKYLEKAGKYLTKQHGLCNIGQWHSHHRINLPRPSGGDENTVWGNMPNLGLKRYIMFIATIQDDYRNPTADVNCFLFEMKNGDRLPVLQGTLEQVKGDSPLRLNENIHQFTSYGAESVHSPKITRKTEKFQEILETAQSQNPPSTQKERKSVLVGKKVGEDHGNKIKPPTSGDQSQIRNIKNEQQEVFKPSREHENTKDTDAKEKKENDLPGTNKESPTNTNEGNSQIYRSKSNNDQRDNASAPQNNYPPNNVINQQPQAITNQNDKNRPPSWYDNVGQPSTNMANQSGNSHDTPSGTFNKSGNIPDREADEKNCRSNESDENKHANRCFPCFLSWS